MTERHEINRDKLEQVVEQMVGGNRGLLAMDESPGTMDRKLDKANVSPGQKNRYAWREVILTTPDLSGIGGTILNPETTEQTIEGKNVVDYLASRNIVPGVKVDLGLEKSFEPLAENLTKGIDTLYPRLLEFSERGLEFAKWRALFDISDEKPSDLAILANANRLGEYAIMCQQLDVSMVPIVEPEIHIAGDHSIEKAEEVGEKVLSKIFDSLNAYGVYLPGMVLKPSMVTPGNQYEKKSSPEQIGQITRSVLENSIPKNVKIAVLSGGLTDDESVNYLNAVNNISGNRITFSFNRAITQAALEAWAGESKNIEHAQKLITERAKASSLASEGKLPDQFEYDSR